ncbi:hypothetical protein DL96DRAFT_1682362 [Flagelloscypha sp. PMI_526]|nr:hypothetical protein DL96DRAFT_1682362 [Flagelloscypha sp. PMI_526]
MKVFVRLALLVSGAVAVAARSSEILAAPYLGTKVFRVPTSNASSVFQYEQLIEKLDLPTWTDASLENSWIDVQVEASKVDQFTEAVDAIIASHDIGKDVITMHEDLGASIAAETEGMFDEKVSVEAVNATWFNAYHTYAEHVQFFTDLHTQFPNNTKLVSAGTSLEGRSLLGIQIYGSAGPDIKPAIIYHSTVHAREWITTMVNEYIAWMLLSTATGEAATYLNKFDFFIFPFSNPDGKFSRAVTTYSFVYTQTSTRLWRKNRHAAPSGSTCLGVDINRNWAHSSWSQSAGASTSPCAEDYKGASAASEPETKALAAFITGRKSVGAGVAGYLDWHSYSQLAMAPYGYSCSKAAADATELNSLVSGFATALRAVHGTSFQSGPICTTIYQVSGDSVDWNYDTSLGGYSAGVKYSFTVELRDTGNYGFVLPASQILPSGEEVWAGVKYLWTNMKV